MGGVVVDKFLKYLSIAAAAIGVLWQNMPVIYQGLLVVVAFDIVTGAIRAYTQKNMSASVAWSSMAKKVGEILIVAFAAYMQSIPPINNVPIAAAVAAFYVYVEALSVVENLAAIGVPIPQILRDALATLAPAKSISMPAPVPPAPVSNKNNQDPTPGTRPGTDPPRYNDR